MPRGFSIPGQAYDPITGELLTPEEQDAYQSLHQSGGFRPVEPMGPVAPEPTTGNPELDQRLAGMASGFGDRNVPDYGAAESLGYGLQAASVPFQLLDSGRGALAAGLTPDTGMGFTDRVKAGALRPQEYPFRNAAGFNQLPDNDIIGSLSMRDIAGGVGDIALDPSNYIPLGALGKGDDVARAAGRRVAQEGAEASTKGILRDAAEGAPGAIQRATDVPFRPRLLGASDDTAKAMADIADSIIPGEKPAIGLLRQYEGTVNTLGLGIRRELDNGNALLKQADIGRPTGTSRIVDRSPEMEELFKALHGEAPPPTRLHGVFDELKKSVDAETQAAIDFDPKFMAHPDYFPRGWKQVEVDGTVGRVNNPGSGVVGATPGYAKPRVDETFSEILDKTFTRPDGTQYRLEPASWNPFEQLALRKQAGAEYREQTALIQKLKLSGAAIPVDGPVPVGYKVPRIGPAFEGKPKVSPPEDGAAPSFYGFTQRYAVPENVSNVLENMYGSKPDLGKVVEGVLSAGQASKRLKLLASLFQQVDFSTRTGVYDMGGAIDDLLSGKPISAVTKVAKIPVDLGNLVVANLSPKRRALLRDEILSGKPIFPERPGITLKGVAEAGWNQQDISIARRDIRSAIKSAVDGESLPEFAKRNLQRLEAVNSRGLFDGVYPQAQVTAIKNWALPRLMRQHPDWSDEQIMGAAANEINKAFSTLGDYQTYFNNPNFQHIARGLIFSTNEPEALLRGAGSMFKGPNKRLWAEAYAGGFLFLAGVANVVHAASTTILDGAPEFLPLDRYNPVREDENTPLGYTYNSKFLSPDTPITAGGRRLALDLMGQMDTALRILDPVGFISGRWNTIPRAVQNQLKGEDFSGNRIDQIGPEGIVSRLATAASDLYEPISVGQVRNAAGLTIGEGEPVGVTGGIVQAGGLNLRAEPLKDAAARGGWDALAPSEQVKGLAAQSWADLGASERIPEKYKDEIAQFSSHFEWKKAAIEQYRQMRIEKGIAPELATAVAEKDFEKNPLEQHYSEVRNVYERRWVVANPSLAIKVMGEDAKLPRNERRLSLNTDELAFLIRESAKPKQ